MGEDENNQKINKESNWRDYRNRGIAIFLVMAACILFFFAIYKIDEILSLIQRILGILQPIIFGFIIAYLLDPIVVFLNEKIIVLFQNMKNQKKARTLSQGISILIAILLMIALIFALGYLVIPEFLSSIITMAVEFPGYVDNFLTWMRTALEGENRFAELATNIVTNASGYIENWLRTDFIKQIESYLGYFTTGVFGVMTVVFNLLIGMVISVYVLGSKNKFIGQGKKMIYSIFRIDTANVIMSTLRKSNQIFGGFISGKLLDALIVGVICFIGMTILQIPYTLLVSVVIGVTNIIPFFGPYIGAIPSALLILLADPIKGVVFIIFIIILQQVDGNIIVPKILGNTVGLSAFWVIFAILLGGGLFGLLGMIIGVPVFAVIYDLIKTMLEYRLKKKQLPINTETYAEVEHIDKDSNHLSYMEAQEKTGLKEEIKENLRRRHMEKSDKK